MSFQCYLLCVYYFSVLFLVTFGLPYDNNKLDNSLIGGYTLYDDVHQEESPIFAEEEGLLEYTKESNIQKNKKYYDRRDNIEKNHKKALHHQHDHAEVFDSKQVKQSMDLANILKNGHTCGPLTLPVCNSLDPYPLAQFPNVLGHASEHESNKYLAPYLELMNDKKCRDVLTTFLCLTLAPQCTGTDEPLPPCRSVCRSAKEGCWQTLKHAKITWPEEWKCDKFPKTGLCADIERQTTPVPEPITKSKQRSLSLKSSNHVLRDHRTDQYEPSIQQELNADQYEPSKQRSPTINNAALTNNQRRNMKLRRYDMGQLGQPGLFQGWADVQGQGSANDYCRVIGTNPRLHFLSCTLGGTTQPDHHYVSRRGFDVGHENTWFMRDMDGDGRDDYCRCVGHGIKSVVSCMKAGNHGFYGSPQQPGNEYTFTIVTPGPCFQKKVNPFIGI